jgi:MFS family permease
VITATAAATRADLRWNVCALGADYALFLVGLGFASAATVLPAFAAWLGAPNVVIGAIPAVMTVGWFLPSLFTASHTETLERKLPFILRWTLWERVPFAVLTLAALLLAERAPALTLAVLLAALLVTTAIGGALMPAWMDVIGRVVPVTLRGRFFALASLGANATALAGSFLVAHVLATVAAPASYGLCFALATLAMAGSYAALAVVREPPSGAPAPRVSLAAYLGRVPALLARDRNLAWFLLARGLAISAMMSSSFFTVWALRAWAAPAREVGLFTAFFFCGQMLGNAALGSLADRAGHRVVIIVGVSAMLAANALALAAPTLGVFRVVFALAGVQVAAVNVSSLSVLLEFAPSAAEQPTLVGLGSTLMAPVAFAVPLAFGVLADAAGIPVIFAVAAGTGVLSLAVLGLRVRDPRAAAVG